MYILADIKDNKKFTKYKHCCTHTVYNIKTTELVLFCG